MDTASKNIPESLVKYFEELNSFNLSIIGVGLIGGSFSLSLKKYGIVNKVFGVSKSAESAELAKELGIIDEIATLDEAIENSEVIFVAIPVDATLAVMENIMKKIKPNQIVIDAGSTKSALCKALDNYPNRNQFVASHPMWGTEYSGPKAAIADAFVGRACVICDREKSAAEAIIFTENVYKLLGMHIIDMESTSHDVHAAYISHISHITSFALANTVLEKEKEEDAIFEMAGGGFESTVRLAKSSPEMWAPIFIQNKENVLDVLNEHISQLRKFKSALEKENWEYLSELMFKANEIKRILK